jgi:uncharacterized protein with NRDE domain
VADYLAGSASAERHAAVAVRDGSAFGAFNLLLYDGRELWLASNRGPATRLDEGLHAFSNAPPGVEWPKTASARAGAERLAADASPIEPLFALLAERDDSGSPQERYERTHFVVGPVYGTRCSTVVSLDAEGRATFAERSFDTGGKRVGDIRESFELERAG